MIQVAYVYRVCFEQIVYEDDDDDDGNDDLISLLQIVLIFALPNTVKEIII